MPAPSPSFAVSLADLAVSARTLVLRLGGPIDWTLRRLRGRGHLPPLWLRRHSGPLSHCESAARAAAAILDRLGLVEEGDLVVDLGCGWGSMAQTLGQRMGERGRYLGLDIHEPSIRWCRRQWAGDPRFRFERAEVASPYAAGTAAGALDPRDPSAGAGRASMAAGPVGSYRFPVADGAAGFVLAKSLFTHLLEAEARHYLAEIRRVLGTGRRALVTAFLFAGGKVRPPAFAHPRHAGTVEPVRWRRAARPRAAVAYDRDRFDEMIAEAGLTTTAFVPGFWPGTDRPPAGQDTLVLERSTARAERAPVPA